MYSESGLPGGGCAIVEKGALSDCGKIFRSFFPVCRAAVITDDNVEKLYFKAVSESLSRCGYEVFGYTVKSGEQSKNWAEAGRILSFLAENGFTGSDIAVTLGGGVVGDLGAFAASVYHRGIRVVSVPTTVLAAIDSSVGGKTAVNLPEGKNLAGTFLQPSLVMCDPFVFASLGKTELDEGLGELCKYSLLSGEIFDVADLNNADIMSGIVLKCIEYKSVIVKKDVYDKGLRRVLNLGHTYAHAVEAASGFTVPHGIAVFAGLKKITKTCRVNGIMSDGEYNRCKSIMEKYPVDVPGFIEGLPVRKYISFDKKCEGGDITLALLSGFGKPFLKKMTVGEAEELLCR